MLKQRSLVFATAALVGAALVFGYTLARAVTTEKQPKVAVPVPTATSDKAASADVPVPSKGTRPAGR
jgi:hypothetical protein